ncbi:MAG: 50S ribosomal protein L31 [Patescibacteria group bacterium]
MKKDLHPEWHPDATITCNGEVIATVGSTVKEMEVEVWAGNHPFFTGQSNVVDTAGRVDRFKRLQEKQSAVSKQRSTKTVKKAKQAKARSDKDEK